jgi:hypothetical protein
MINRLIKEEKQIKTRNKQREEKQMKAKKRREEESK